MDFKKLLGEGAKEMLQSAALGGIKELGKIMLERDALKEKCKEMEKEIDQGRNKMQALEKFLHEYHPADLRDAANVVDCAIRVMIRAEKR
jgi:hypothetical protein